MEQVPGDPQGPAGRDPSSAPSLPRCYRHPDRETGIRCVRCERPICPECMVSASVGFQCPECVRQGSGTGHAPEANRPRTIAGGTVAADPRLLTKILIGINIAVFILVQVRGQALVDQIALLGQAQLPSGSVAGVAQGEWYRLLTSMFTHQAVAHIAFNMLSLWWVGAPLEAALGRLRYLSLYLVSGLAGSALAYLLAAQNVETVGASGAIFGLFGATAVLMHRLRLDLRPVIAMLVINLVITFAWAGISWQAHIGGLVAGVVTGYAMVHAPRRHRALIQYGTCAAVLLVVVVLTLIRTAQLS
ncbi:rhomboid family intramembrane serine protease [Streptomyces sp. NPDC008150]|uniref:rhomboid family intramembrane serine protease n=1 Tax=Streptomyces sp. NPDC008150 TaxID=3364816 RepID=UPI0036E4BCC7